jgi:hypothetical protein
MNKLSKPTKDQYGNYINEEDFDKYWDDYHRLEDLSMKESIRQKEERLKKLNIDL